LQVWVFFLIIFSKLIRMKHN